MPRRSAKKRTSRKTAGENASGQRLQRLLAAAGYGSRRQCEQLIEAGRVHVDNEVVTKLGTSADPDVQKIRVDGVVLKKQKLVYYAVNKPVGVVTTNRDPQGRPRVVDLVPPDERVFPVGRLDRSSEGLILLTNDGELAQRLTHPKFGIRKIYRVTVAGKVDNETMRKMREGIYISEGLVRVDGAKLLKAKSRVTEMEIVLREGKNREIRRILARFGHKVQQLRRIAVGSLRLGDMPPGAYRVLLREEVDKLWADTEAAERNLPTKLASKKRATKKRATKKRATKKSAVHLSRNKRSGGKTRKDVAGKRRPETQLQLPSKPKASGAVIGGDSPEPVGTPRKRPVKPKPQGGKAKSGDKRKLGGRNRATGKPSAVRKKAGNRRTKKR